MSRRTHDKPHIYRKHSQWHVNHMPCSMSAEAFARRNALWRLAQDFCRLQNVPYDENGKCK